MGDVVFVDCAAAEGVFSRGQARQECGPVDFGEAEGPSRGLTGLCVEAHRGGGDAVVGEIAAPGFWSGQDLGIPPRGLREVSIAAGAVLFFVVHPDLDFFEAGDSHLCITGDRDRFARFDFFGDGEGGAKCF